MEQKAVVVPGNSASMDDVRNHIQMLHDCAAPLTGKGKLILASFGEDPATGRSLPPKILHFEIGEVDAMTAAAKQLSGETNRNVYAPFAVFRPDLPSGKKGSEADVIAVLGLIADFDDARASDWATRLACQPDYVLETSSGRFQCFSIFSEPVPAHKAKPLAAALKNSANCDHGTADTSHVWRAPGLRNWPNSKKLSEGRPAAPQMVKVVKAWTGTRSNFAELVCAYESDSLPISRRRKDALEERIESAKSEQQVFDANSETNFSDKPFPPEVTELLSIRVPKGERSEHAFKIVQALINHGCSDETIADALLTSPTSEKYRGSRKATLTDVKRIRLKLTSDIWQDVFGDDDIRRLNDAYALVLIGDKHAILKETFGADGKPTVEFLAQGTFRAWHSNRWHYIGRQKITLGDFWLSHPQRRQYEGIAFEPSGSNPKFYNIWRGFSVAPRRGDWSKFYAHLRDNVCNGNEDHLRWIIGWFAAIVQQPNRKMGTALVIRGKEGVGKSKVAEVFGSLFGRHYVKVSDPRYVTGKFNSHMWGCLLLHAEEAFFAGDHSTDGILKDLITGDTQLIEYKGKEAISVRNHIRLLITSNNDWVVRASSEARRYAVFDVSEAQIQNHSYFAAIDHEMDNGGREALLYDLLHFNLSTIDVRTVPKTAALLEQKVASLTPEQGWWIDILQSGRLPWGTGFSNQSATSMLFDNYSDHANKQGVRRRSIETQIGTFLQKMVPGLTRRIGEYRNYNQKGMKGSIYLFPTLEDCRVAFGQLIGQEIEWHGPDDWLDEPERDHDGPM